MWRIFSALKGVSAQDIKYQSSADNSSILQNVLNTAYIWAGVVAVIVIVVAGFMYTVSQDDPSQVSRAKNTLLGAIVGLAVVLLAFVITNTVLNGVF